MRGHRRVAVIGLGRMGTPMAVRLVGAGFDVVGFDAQPDAVSAAGAAGVGTAMTAADAARDADVVILMLPTSDVVESVVDRLEPALADGQIVVDMGSSEPLRTRDLAARLARRGVRLYDAPVSGGVAGAVDGKLAVMAGGDAEGLAELSDVLAVFGRVFPVGPVGSGHAIKALNNLLSAGHLWMTTEAVFAAQDFGIDPDVALAVFNSSSGRSGSSEKKWPDFIRTGTFDSGFGLSLMLKDVGIAAALLDSSGRPSAVAEAVREGWAAAAERLGPAADHTEVARYLEAGNGDRSTIRDPRGTRSNT